MLYSSGDPEHLQQSFSSHRDCWEEQRFTSPRSTFWKRPQLHLQEHAHTGKDFHHLCDWVCGRRFVSGSGSGLTNEKTRGQNQDRYAGLLGTICYIIVWSSIWLVNFVVRNFLLHCCMSHLSAVRLNTLTKTEIDAVFIGLTLSILTDIHTQQSKTHSTSDSNMLNM